MAGAVLGLVAALGFGIAIFVGSSPPERSLEPLGFSLLWAMPALLALLSLRERPVLLVPAAVLSFFLSFGALSGVTLVLLIPTICYVLAFWHRRYYPSTLTRPLIAVVLPVLAGAGALVALLADSEQVCWTYVEDTDGERSYTEAACDDRGGVGPVMLGGPATSVRPPGQADSGSGSGASESYGSEMVAPGESGVTGSGGGSTSTPTPAAAAASAVLVVAGLGSGWAAARSGDGNGAFAAPF